MSISYDLITARVGFRRRKKTRATAWMWKQTPGKWRGPRIREARWTSTSACGCWWWQLFHTVVSLAGLPSTASSSLYRPKLRHNPRSVDNLMNIYCSWSWSQDRRASLSLPPQHHRFTIIIINSCWWRLRSLGCFLPGIPPHARAGVDRTSSQTISPPSYSIPIYSIFCLRSPHLAFPPQPITFPILFYVFSKYSSASRNKNSFKGSYRHTQHTQVRHCNPGWTLVFHVITPSDNQSPNDTWQTMPFTYSFTPNLPTHH